MGDFCPQRTKIRHSGSGEGGFSQRTNFPNWGAGLRFSAWITPKPLSDPLNGVTQKSVPVDVTSAVLANPNTQKALVIHCLIFSSSIISHPTTCTASDQYVVLGPLRIIPCDQSHRKQIRITTCQHCYSFQFFDDDPVICSAACCTSDKVHEYQCSKRCS